MPELKYVDECKIELVNTNASDDMAAMSAWVSFDDDKSDRLKDREGIGKLLKFLYRNKHMSPFEHGQFIGKAHVPLFVRSEWHRHRTQSYNEISTRYVEMDPVFYLPPRERPLQQVGKPGNYSFVEGTDEQYAITVQNLKRTTEVAWEGYQNTLSAGVAKEVARMNLPVNLMTQFYFSVNPRNMMAFLDLRNDSHALYEIRLSAVQVEEFLKDAMPLTYEAYKSTKELIDNPPVVVNVTAGLDADRTARLVAKTLDDNARLRMK